MHAAPAPCSATQSASRAQGAQSHVPNTPQKGALPVVVKQLPSPPPQSPVPCSRQVCAVVEHVSASCPVHLLFLPVPSQMPEQQISLLP